MPAEAHGKCDEKFAPVRDALIENFETRGDVGASFAMTIEGETYGKMTPKKVAEVLGDRSEAKQQK